jgi:hypothetical protein
MKKQAMEKQGLGSDSPARIRGRRKSGKVVALPNQAIDNSQIEIYQEIL